MFVDTSHYLKYDIKPEADLGLTEGATGGFRDLTPESFLIKLNLDEP